MTAVFIRLLTVYGMSVYRPSLGKLFRQTERARYPYDGTRITVLYGDGAKPYKGLVAERWYDYSGGRNSGPGGDRSYSFPLHRGRQRLIIVWRLVAVNVGFIAYTTSSAWRKGLCRGSHPIAVDLIRLSNHKLVKFGMITAPVGPTQKILAGILRAEAVNETSRWQRTPSSPSHRLHRQ
ncbi:uncharacterized protein EV420DRAFT_503535 [Desarmillaria tabescens]|uniref:Uncharacterized protein n=1 Tax=Armillaria tabescens TaxID=1929756 RepID=A0AA39N484_ARMTA|nr:uncharacterized protein EV420DRAFT_503535 [Desarmillaria tabescens]KAK0457591.1 hypothetical protein EV420DRAFT_503535 [Desarmillaria tabescens]